MYLFYKEAFWKDVANLELISSCQSQRKRPSARSVARERRHSVGGRPSRSRPSLQRRLHSLTPRPPRVTWARGGPWLQGLRSVVRFAKSRLAHSRALSPPHALSVCPVSASPCHRCGFTCLIGQPPGARSGWGRALIRHSRCRRAASWRVWLRSPSKATLPLGHPHVEDSSLAAVATRGLGIILSQY